MSILTQSRITCPRNGDIHSGLGPPTSINNQDIPSGQADLGNPQPRPSTQRTLGCVFQGLKHRSYRAAHTIGSELWAAFASLFATVDSDLPGDTSTHGQLLSLTRSSEHVAQSRFLESMSVCSSKGEGAGSTSSFFQHPCSQVNTRHFMLQGLLLASQSSGVIFSG